MTPSQNKGLGAREMAQWLKPGAFVPEIGSQHLTSDSSQLPMSAATVVPGPSSSLLGSQYTCHNVARTPTDTKIRTASEELHLRLASGLHMHMHVHTNNV